MKQLLAYVSGQAGLVAISRPAGYDIYHHGEADPQTVGSAAIGRILQDYNDVKQLHVKSIEEAITKADSEWSKTRAVRLFIMVIDPSEPDDGLDKIADLLERLLCQAPVRLFVEEQFFAQELPNDVRFDRLVRYAKDRPFIYEVVTSIEERQLDIARVRRAFSDIDDHIFSSDFTKKDFWEVAITFGCVRTLVVSAGAAKSVNRAIFDLHTRLSGVPNYRAVIAAWTDGFSRYKEEKKVWVEPAEARPKFREEGGGPGGHQALRQALDQQAAIIERVRQGNYADARHFTRDLVNSQVASGAEFVGKSLTRLSQAAKELQAYELNLEWAKLAADINPTDPRTRGQLGDALLSVGRFAEARVEFEAAGTFGDLPYSLTGMARVLREQGRSEEALQAYRAAKLQMKGRDDEPYAWAGVAECLRDIGDLTGALEEYIGAVDCFPYDPAVRCGQAATLAEMGRFAEAYSVYVTATELSSDKVVPRHGIASLARSAGRLDEARQLYGALVHDFPDNFTSKVGLIDVERARGAVGDALALARSLYASAPGSPIAALKVGETLSEAGRHVDAVKFLRGALNKFEFEPRLWSGVAMAERRRGRPDRSLQAYDAAIQHFPNDRSAQLGRAHVLRRLQQVGEAEHVYRAVLERAPDDLVSSNALASILIFQGKFEEAFTLVRGDNPRSVEEWRSFLLLAILNVRAGFEDEAMRRMTWAISNCPFAREVRAYRAALAALHLKRGRANRAAKAIDGHGGELSNVIQLHAFAANQQRNKAKQTLAELKSFLPPQYAVIRDEIARIFRLSAEPARYGNAWLLAAENDALLLDIAA